ncbi:S-layer homology domain-containing protein [Lysinibacillus irui]|uniref:S-layer homology domain-containing protein n=1 Tax=Lysinibacillus irui TaxID=2998077 RepID=A0AAJ5USH2_9BACI|nr:S-layer homology domain-containing protein [Lysinibacillus irui]WDV06009.1 S-layer homology domain-containing protein [Lysinibacillus irui]
MERKQKKWWQRSLALMLSLVLVISSFLVGGMPVSYAASLDVVYVSNGGDDTTGNGSEASPYNSLHKAYQEVDNEGTIYVMDDITLKVMMVGRDKKFLNMALDKNVTITAAPGVEPADAVIRRGSGETSLIDLQLGQLTLKDIIIDGSLEGTTAAGRIINVGNAKLIIKDGAILRNNESSVVGSAIILNNSNAVVEMTGGEVTGNKDLSLDLKSRTSAILINASGATFSMSGGQITSNSGGGVDVESGGRFMLSGNAQITGNTVDVSGQATERNVILQGTTLVTLNGVFDGKAGITANSMKPGVQFGQATTEGLTGLKNLFADNIPDLIAAYGENKALVWKSKVAPGGIKNKQPVLWLKANEGLRQQAGLLTGWEDQSFEPINFTLDVPEGQEIKTPEVNTNGVNFNPSVKFKNNAVTTEHYAVSPKLIGDKEITFRSGFAVYKNPTDSAGALVGAKDQRLDGNGNIQANGVIIIGGFGNAFVTGPGISVTYDYFGTVDRTRHQLANYELAASNNHSAKIDGKVASFSRNNSFSEFKFYPVVGATNGGGSDWHGFGGDVAEIILYDQLTSADAPKIESYLAVKYGITLNGGNSDYIDTNGNPVWNADPIYKSNIAGIGRDDAEDLLQKQSQSINADKPQVAIGLGALAGTNAENTNPLTDKQYLIWGDNGKALTFTQPIEDTTEKGHAERIWKVQNTNNVGQVQIAIPADAVDADATLLVSDTETFSIKQEKTLTKIMINGVNYYAANVTLANGQYFTFASPAPKLASAELEQAQAGGNQISLTFDKDIASSISGIGFTITVGGENIKNATFKVDPTDAKKVIISLPVDKDLTGKEVTIKYDGLGNLKGTNGVPVSDFEESIVNKTALQAKVAEEGTLTESAYTPSSWTEYQAKLTEAKAVLAKPDATQAEVDAALAALTKAQNDLVPVSEVDKTALQAKVAEEGTLTESAYTPSSWAEYQAKLTEAKAILAKPDATQAEVDAALAALTKAQNDLVPVSEVDKTDLQAKVAEEGTLTESAYTPSSWAEYQAKLTEAKAILAKPDATQAEVDAALAALTKAQNDLVPVSEVDKTDLQAKVAEEGTLTEVDYTPASWTEYQAKLTEAKEVLAKQDATQAEVDAALAALTKAQSDLVPSVPGVDKTALQAKVAEEGTLTEVNYTPASWTEYQAKLTEAKEVLAKQDATQAEVDAALAALTKAQNDLVPSVPGVDKTALQAKVAEEGTLTEVNYTPASWTEYQAKLTEAKEVLAKPDATQAEVNAALAALTKAQNDLVPVSEVDKTALQAKVTEEGTLTEVNYTPTSWTEYQAKLTEAKAILAKPDATQAEVDAALAALTKAQNALTKNPLPQAPGLGSLIPSQGTLSPSFSSEVTDYTMNVDYATSQLSFLATPIIPGASVTTTVNGQLGTLEQIPLQVGENIIVITVADGNGNVKHYTIKVYREAYTGGGNSGGGGTWTPDPTPPVTPTPSETKTKIQVELEIDGDNPLEKTTVEIERTKHANGDVTDFVNLTPAQALEAVEKAKQIGNSIARIVIPDVKDEVDQVTVEVPKQSLQTLRDNGLSLEISTENGHIAIPHSSMEGIDDNFYFRLVPVKKESERQAIEERAKAEQVVRETLESDDVHVVARPMTIETNMPSRPVQVTLPLKGVNVPTVAAERQAFLDQLAVFIEHSDGEKKVVFPEVVTMAKGELGLRFTVEKFSTFTIIQFEKPEVSEHEAYIKGFPNGTFGPDKNVTRAQIAIMMARILGYTEGQAVHKAPFKDVAKDHSAAGAIAFVKEQGIMNGDQYGNFHANANITRAEMAAVVANYKQLSVEEGVPITFKDTKGHWAQWIIEANRASGIINGLEDGSFAPNAALTRAQAVVMMNRMFERGPLQGVAKPSFPDVKATHWAFKEIEEAANSHKYFIDEDGKEQLSK